MPDTRAVLFVDDERPILNAINRLMRKEPCAVHLAEGGAEGLEILSRTPVQVVVTDQRMPEMTGTEFLQAVRERWPDTVRMVLSGYADAATIVESINKGEVYRFIAKPWHDEALRHTIAQGFEHWAMVQENRRLTLEAEHHVAELRRLNALLEGSVEAQARSLQFSQDVLEQLPEIVLGISAEGEIVLTNGQARRQLAPLRSLLPGTAVGEVLPPEAAAAVRGCLQARDPAPFSFAWEGRRLRARPALLRSGVATRGCVLLLDEEGGG